MLLEKNRAMIEEGYETYRELMLKKPYADPSAENSNSDDCRSESQGKEHRPGITVDSSFVEQLKREGAFDR